MYARMYTRLAFIAVSYSCRRSAALCKMPLLTTDDSIITLRKSCYLGRAICRAVMSLPRVCVYMYASVFMRAGIIIIMTLLAIMKDSGIWRIHRLAPRATRVMHTVAKNLTYLYYTSRSALRARAFQVITYVESTLYAVTHIREREREQIAATRAIPKDKRELPWRTRLVILPAKDSARPLSATYVVLYVPKKKTST